MRILMGGLIFIFVIIFLSSSGGSLMAEGETENSEPRKVLGLFGSITSFGTAFQNTSHDNGSSVAAMNLAIALSKGAVPQLESAFSGPIIYRQLRGGGKTTSLPRAASFIAVGQDDGFIGIYQNSAGNIVTPPTSWYEKGSKITVESENPALAQASWQMSVFDTNKATWVNPLLFNTITFADTAAPQFISIAFHGVDSSHEYAYDKKLKPTMQVKQGKYRLGMEIQDRTQKGGSFSGVHSFRILMDGVTVLEKKLDTIWVSADGYAPFNNKPPSKNSLDAHGRLIIGELDLVRGIHVLDIMAADFSGNAASMQLRLMVE